MGSRYHPIISSSTKSIVRRVIIMKNILIYIKWSIYIVVDDNINSALALLACLIKPTQQTMMVCGVRVVLVWSSSNINR